MKSTKKTFINECNNEITLSVEERELSGVPGILISITGPISEITNHITKKEAEILLEELKQTLSL